MNQGRHHPKSSFAVLDLAEQSEEQLIDRGLKGDARALDALFARNTRALYQTALRVLGNPEDAEEALQEGLLCDTRKAALPAELLPRSIRLLCESSATRRTRKKLCRKGCFPRIAICQDSSAVRSSRPG